MHTSVVRKAYVRFITDKFRRLIMKKTFIFSSTQILIISLFVGCFASKHYVWRLNDPKFKKAKTALVIRTEARSSDL